MASSIPIEYINDTKKTDFKVLVFTKNYSVNTPKTYYVAWQILTAETSSQFEYAATISVGATYQKSGQIITAGPFQAELGSTWEIQDPEEGASATLTKGIYIT
jgi:dynein heavy chain 1